MSVVILLSACACTDPESRTPAPFRATSRPYKIKEKWHYPQQHYELEEVGIASWYGGRDGCHGLPTACGRKFDMFAHTCAHKTLPLPCVIRVTNLENGRQVDLEVIDRGPFKYDRILDVSVAAALTLGFYAKGTTSVHIRTLVEESLALQANNTARDRAALEQRRRGGQGLRQGRKDQPWRQDSSCVVLPVAPKSVPPVMSPMVSPPAPSLDALCARTVLS